MASLFVPLPLTWTSVRECPSIAALGHCGSATTRRDESRQVLTPGDGPGRLRAARAARCPADLQLDNGSVASRITVDSLLPGMNERCVCAEE